MKVLSAESTSLIGGGSRLRNNSATSSNLARARIQQQRENFFGPQDVAKRDCIVISVFASAAAIPFPYSAPIGAGVAAYVCSS